MSVLVLAWVAAASAGPFTQPCGLPLVHEALRPVNRTIDGPTMPALPGAKGLRNPYGTPFADSSENFAVHWGSAATVTQADVDRLLAAFELAWEVQVGDMGHVAPFGTDAYLFNVYIGDSGGGAPPGYGAGGYYWVDEEGWPMIVIAAGTLDDELFTTHAAIHEFYHAIQGATGRYEYAGISAWYTEATAEWAAVETDPESPVNGPFVFAYGLLPELPLNYFDYPDSGILEEYYQYGAFVFPTFAADLAGWELIRDSWIDPGTDPDPMEVLRDLLGDQGYDFDEVFLDHIARNATWDYPQGDLYASMVDQYGDWYQIDPALASYSGDGTGGIQSAKGGAPRRYGYNAIHLRNPLAGTLEVMVVGQAEGTQGSPARHGARLVRELDDGTVTYHPVPFDEDNVGELTVELGEDEDVWLMVGAWTPEADPSRWEDERFGYDYELLVTPAPVEDPYADGERPVPGSTEIVCGCASGPGAPGGLLPLGLLLLGTLTTRRQARADLSVS